MTRFSNGLLILKEEKNASSDLRSECHDSQNCTCQVDRGRKNVNPSWQLETDRVGQRLTLGPSPSNWRFYAKMHIWRCLGLARNGLGVELDQRQDVRRALTTFLFEPCASAPISTQGVATGASKVSSESQR